MSGKISLAPKKRTGTFPRLPPPRFVPGLGDLIDRLTVDQLKEALHKSLRASVRTEIADLEHDIDGWADRHQLKLSGRNVRIITVLAQINYEIWMCKERMSADPQRYDQWLKRAHQLNGIRNRMKNLLLAQVHTETRVCPASNISIDELEDWNVQL